jgi:2-polyprenyl-3-methyl-5-hydroxy-6-metoxy-1,4-benzoquinol methylase
MQSPIRLDHVATWNEVREALAFSPLSHVRDFECEVVLDFGAAVGLLTEELAWLELASKVQDDWRN